jgi:hypothetical protein
MMRKSQSRVDTVVTVMMGEDNRFLDGDVVDDALVRRSCCVCVVAACRVVFT